MLMCIFLSFDNLFILYLHIHLITPSPPTFRIWILEIPRIKTWYPLLMLLCYPLLRSKLSPNIVTFKEQPFYYILWFCGSKMFAVFSWVILLFHVSKSDHLIFCSLGSMFVRRVQNSFNHIPGRESWKAGYSLVPLSLHIVSDPFHILSSEWRVEGFFYIIIQESKSKWLKKKGVKKKYLNPQPGN